MLVIKILERVEEYISDVGVHELQNAINNFLNKLSLNYNYVDTYLDVLDYLTGTATADDPKVLNDTTADFPIDNSLIGATIKNITDGSEGTITVVTATSLEVTSLSGGSDNSWDTDDVYRIETTKIALPRTLISINQIHLEVDGESEEIPQTMLMHEYLSGDYDENIVCLVQDRIIYFPEEIKYNDVLKLVSSLPYNEYTSMISNTTDIDIPDKYLELMRCYCIKEICVLPQYTEKLGYLFNKFEVDYNNALLDLNANQNTATFTTGDEF